MRTGMDVSHLSLPERQGVLLDNVHIEHLFIMLEIDESSAYHRDKIASLFRNIIF